jgi:hypothetical protein
MSVCERLMTLNTSAVAVCLAKASVNSAFRASSSVNRRTFSMAMTAWSATVLNSSTCASENRPGRSRMTPIVPIGLPSRSIGTLMMPRQPPATARSVAYSGTVCRSSILTMSPARIVRPSGCSFSIRPARIHPLHQLERFGRVVVVRGYVEARARRPPTHLRARGRSRRGSVVQASGRIGAHRLQPFVAELLDGLLLWGELTFSPDVDKLLRQISGATRRRQSWCDGCGLIIRKAARAVTGIIEGDWRAIRLHLDCFRVWEAAARSP